MVLTATVSLPAAPVPRNRQIAASIVQTLAAPADQPMHMPTDVCVDSAGRVYVLDGTNNRIVIFDAQGRFTGTITRIDSETLSQPVGLTIDSRDQIWVTDTGQHRLLVLTTEGKLVERITLPAVDAQHPFDPTDVAVTADGRRTYVVDNDNHRVVIRDNASGTWVVLGQFGRALGQFEWPFMICIAPNGDVYVSEAIGARLQRISPTDKWAGEVGTWGIELGQLYRPKGVAADRSNRVYVSDSTTGVVQVFLPTGESCCVLTAVTGEQPQLLRFSHPMGMTFDRAGRLYVVELRANRVAVVTLESAASMPATQPAGGGTR